MCSFVCCLGLFDQLLAGWLAGFIHSFIHSLVFQAEFADISVVAYANGSCNVAVQNGNQTVR